MSKKRKTILILIVWIPYSLIGPGIIEAIMYMNIDTMADYPVLAVFVAKACGRLAGAGMGMP